MKKLSIGDTAPFFECLNQDKVMISLPDLLAGRHLVLFFYPKDDTPGCTLEACGFRDNYEIFLDNGVNVAGISADSPESHKEFIRRHKLPYTLLSDPKNSIRQAFGVEGGLFGLLPGRETFLIDRSGIIRNKFSSHIDIQGHISKTLAVIKTLETQSPGD